jgi:predicted RNase H-like HicB family nuclease
MASSSRGGGSHADEIRLWPEDGTWIAKDVETGVTTQGSTHHSALENLEEAVALHRGEIGRPPTDEERRDLGIEPENDTAGDDEPPDVLR